MRANRLLLSPRAALLSLLLIGTMVFTMTSAPFSGLYLFGAVVLLFPYLLQVLVTTSGLIPAIIALGIAFAGAFKVFGMEAALFSLCFLLPLTALMYLCLSFNLDYRKAMPLLVAGYALTAGICFVLARRILSPDPFTALSKLAIAALDGMADRDAFLNTFYRHGLLGLPEELARDPLVAAGTGYTFSPGALAEFYKQAGTRIELWLRALLPVLVSNYSIQWGVGGLFFSMHYGKRQAQRYAYFGKEGEKPEDYLPDLGLPPFSQWFMPRQPGYLLYAMLGLWLISRLSGNAAMLLPGQMLYNAAAAILGLQGLSFVNHTQKKRDTKPRLRGLTLAALHVFLPLAALVLGIGDQLLDPRKLRPGKEGGHESKGESQ